MIILAINWQFFRYQRDYGMKMNLSSNSFFCSIIFHILYTATWNTDSLNMREKPTNENFNVTCVYDSSWTKIIHLCSRTDHEVDLLAMLPPGLQGCDEHHSWTALTEPSFSSEVLGNLGQLESKINFSHFEKIGLA